MPGPGDAATTPEAVGVARYLGIFAAAYIVLMLVLGLAATLIGMQGSTGLNVGVLIGACMTSSYCFTRRQQRLFTRIEYHKMLWGSLAIDLGIQLVVTLIVISIPLNGLVIAGLLFIGVLHALAIAFFYSQRMTRNLLPRPKTT